MSPCDAQLARPPYGGSDSGYIVRTTDVYNIQTLPDRNVPATKLNCVFTYTPWNLSTGTGIVSGLDTGTTITFANTGITNFVTTNGVVREYRPVAACMRWVPTGASGVRSGSVSLGYSSGTYLPLAVPGTASVNAYVSNSLRTSSNGSENHEINWLPSAVDENWTTTGANSSVGVGTVMLALKDIDATTLGAGTTQQWVANGYIEITTVWEWVPISTQGLVTPLAQPSPWSLQAALNSLGEPAGALLNHVGTGLGRAASGMAARGVMSMANGFLRTGYVRPSTRLAY